MFDGNVMLSTSQYPLSVANLGCSEVLLHFSCAPAFGPVARPAHVDDLSMLS